MYCDIVSVRALPHRSLRVTFEDGLVGEVDVGAMVPFTGVFEPLSDPAVFAQVRVDPEAGTVCWPSGADLDPLVLYRLVKSGRPRRAS
jgi:hypothetical protein